MRYWILVALLNGLFTLIMHFAAPEMFGSTAYYAGAAICALIALVITWRDPPGMLDNVLFFLFKWGILAACLVFSVWGVGYKLEFWGEHNPDFPVISASEDIITGLAVAVGAIIICGALFGWYLRRRERAWRR